MALTRIVYTGDGVTNQFALAFPLGYISQTDITCQVNNEVDGGGAPVYRALTFINPSLVQVGGTMPAIGQTIVFLRTVTHTALLVSYTDGDLINDENLNTAQKQAIMLIQQVLDGRFAAISANLNMGGFRVINAADPVDLQDLVTKNWAINSITPPSGPVVSVNSRGGIVVLTNADVGLTNVNNTSDANKPISTAQAVVNSAQTATNATKANLAGGNTFTGAQTNTNGSTIGAKGAALATAATVNIWSVLDGDLVHLTGVVTVASFGTAPQAGASRKVISDGIHGITHNGATLVCPGGLSITTQAGDAYTITADTTTRNVITEYLRADGTALIVAGGSSAKLPRVTIVTAGTSFVTNALTTFMEVEVQGGGGVGGGSSATFVGGNGSGGGYAKRDYTVVGSTSYTIAVGAAGTVGAGGATTFTDGTTLITGGGGVGGAGGTTTSRPPSVGGIATGGQINISGGAGLSTDVASPGRLPAGDSFFGRGGVTISTADSAGAAATGYGAGGGAAKGANSGGAAGAGCIRITEWY